MDTLTHGLFGLAVGALRQPDAGTGQRLSATDRAVLVACVIAAELPDLDYLWPVGDGVLRTLRAHRGLSHSLLAAPFVALAAAVLGTLLVRWRLRWREAVRPAPVFLWAWLAVVAAHLLPDLWTGWGTRLLTPLSSRRFALDWTMVVDPLVTLPLLVGALVAWRRRRGRWRRAILVGLAVAAAYVGSRVVARQVLLSRVRAMYPAASTVEVFPALLRPTTWRYVAVLDETYAVGSVGLRGAPDEQARQPRPRGGAASVAAGQSSLAIHEALAWARFPVVSVAQHPDGAATLRIADLRYHAGGQPTLTFVFELHDGAVVSSRLDRGGSVGELLRRWGRD